MGQAATQQVVFTIDPFHSTLSESAIGGTVSPFAPTTPGSDTSNVTGHFLVSFDPLTNVPANIQFINDNGYYQQTGPISVQSAVPGVFFNYTNLNWDFSSPVISGTSGVFSATTTGFNVRTGATEFIPNNPTETFNETGVVGTLTGGQWTLTQSAPDRAFGH